MARITVEDCIDKFESRFELVLVASNRAKKLLSGENPTVEKDNDKNTVIALREIADETIAIDSLKTKLVEEFQTVSPLDDEEDGLSLEYSSFDNKIDSDQKTDDNSDLSAIDSNETSDESSKNIEENEETISDVENSKPEDSENQL